MKERIYLFKINFQLNHHKITLKINFQLNHHKITLSKL